MTLCLAQHLPFRFIQNPNYVLGKKLLDFIFRVISLRKIGDTNFPFGKKERYKVHPNAPKIKKASTESSQGSLIISSGSSKNSIDKWLFAFTLEAKVKAGKKK